MECDTMSNNEIQRVIDETSFTMEVEGFILTPEEKNTIRKVLSGEIPFEAQLNEYIENARRIGGLSNVS
jgi:hypothetical protein